MNNMRIIKQHTEIIGDFYLLRIDNNIKTELIGLCSRKRLFICLFFVAFILSRLTSHIRARITIIDVYVTEM